MMLVELPQNLILVMKHFKFDKESGHFLKVQQRLLYNESIQLNIEIAKEEKNERYDLYAMIMHSGETLHSGHFYTCAKDSNEQWMKLNDCEVSPLSFHEIQNLGSSAYMMFYRISCDCTNAKNQRLA